MKIWMSGEIQSDIAEGYDRARKQIEAAFNRSFAERDFGEGLVELAYIAIIRKIDSPDYGEVKKYSKRDRSAEFRLKIPHEIFLRANDHERTRLVAASVLRAVGLLRDLKIKNFDHPTFDAEFTAFSRRMGWI
jgi:hypothetical protein